MAHICHPYATLSRSTFDHTLSFDGHLRGEKKDKVMLMCSINTIMVAIYAMPLFLGTGPGQ